MAKRKRMAAAKRREQILGNAAMLLAKEGDFTTANLAAVCEITEPILYRHFPDGKVQMLVELIQNVNSDNGRELQILGALLTHTHPDVRSVALRTARSLRKAIGQSKFDRALVDALIPDRRGGNRKKKTAGQTKQATADEQATGETLPPTKQQATAEQVTKKARKKA